jgi:1-acyl-sn-glycerol-3-phosphate acyltransferase
VRVIRSIWFWVATIIVTGGFSSAVVIASLVRVRRSFYSWIARTWSLWVLRIGGVTAHLEGEENALAGKPRIYVINHQSWFDVWALAAMLPGHHRFVAKKELARIPIFGRAWRVAGHISVDRSDRGAAVRSLDDAGRLIRSDGSGVIIFPEGTRSPDGRLQSFKKGAFMLALHTGVDIVPVAIIGTRNVLPKGSFQVTPGTITIRIGTPIPTADYTTETRDLLMQRTRDAIGALMAGSPNGQTDGRTAPPRKHTANID